MSVWEASEGRPGEVRGESGRRPDRPKRLRFSSFEPKIVIFAAPVHKHGCEASLGGVRGAPGTREGLDSGVKMTCFTALSRHRRSKTRAF